MAATTQYRPREYHRGISNWWWLQRRNYLIFILREFSSVFVAYFLVITLVQLDALARGPESYAHFRAFMANPWIILLNVIALAFLMLHTITWSMLVPRAFYPRSHGHPIPEMTTALPSYIVWAIATIVVAAFILGA